MPERNQGQRHRGEEFRRSRVILDAGPEVVPVAGVNDRFPITLTPFLDHGRPAFITSTIRTSDVLVRVANELTAEESQRLTTGAGNILEELLDGHPARGLTVFSPSDKNKPSIYVASYGDPYNSTGLRLYFHPGEYQGATVLFQDARTRNRSADKVERIFRQAGYTAPKGWEIKRKSS